MPDSLPAYPAQPDEFDGTVIITWPFRRDGVAGLPGWGVSITDAGSGEQINSVLRFCLVYADAEDKIWMEAEAFADADGHLRRSVTGRVAVMDLTTARFRFLVTEMRVAEAGR